jgi:hypothetical protein
MGLLKCDEKEVRVMGIGLLPCVDLRVETIQKTRELNIYVQNRREDDDRNMISLVNMLPRCTRLRTLILAFRMSSKELLMLGHALVMCPSLETVVVTDCSGFSEEALARFQQICSHIRDLRVPKIEWL